jgi:hypothetical protein
MKRQVWKALLNQDNSLKHVRVKIREEVRDELEYGSGNRARDWNAVAAGVGAIERLADALHPATKEYQALPHDIRSQADKQFSLLKANPRHP